MGWDYPGISIDVASVGGFKTRMRDRMGLCCTITLYISYIAGTQAKSCNDFLYHD